MRKSKNSLILYNKILCVIICFFFTEFCHAQSNIFHLNHRKHSDTLIGGKDVIDVIKKWTHINKTDSVHHVIIKPGVPYFVFIPSFGYAQQTGLSLYSSLNCSFYTDSIYKENLSVLFTSIEYTQKGQLSTLLSANVWTKGNKMNILTDIRYELYSQETYGLGGQCKVIDADIIYYNHLRVYQTFQKKLTRDFLAGIGYNLDYFFKIKDQQKTNYPLIPTAYSHYDNAPKNMASGLSLNLLHDARRNTNNPVQSNYANIIYTRYSKTLGSDHNWQSLYLDFRKYIKLPSNSKNILAFWNFNWFTLGGKAPYFVLPSTGGDTYANSGRQYIAGRFRSNNMLYFESEYRFAITKNGLWGGLIFANFQSVSNIVNNQFDNMKGGYGAGFRLKVNKKSNINLIISYGFGASGAPGLFFNLGEVF